MYVTRCLMVSREICVMRVEVEINGGLVDSATNACRGDKRKGVGRAFQPMFCSGGIRASYLECLRVAMASKNLSLQYVNSMNCIWVRKWLES
jgi:hypothetical protein